MMKRKILAGIGLLILIVGCANLSNNIFRTEQTSVDLAYGGYTVWTNYMASHTVSPDASNSVRQARLKFAASVYTLEAFRSAYETNSALQDPLTASLSAVVADSSNLVWLVSYFQQSH